jgi:periplasmic protein TonB
MVGRSFAVSVPVSISAHAAALAVGFVLLGSHRPEPVLFIDLTDPVAVTEVARRLESRAEPPASVAAPRPIQRHDGDARDARREKRRPSVAETHRQEERPAVREAATERQAPAPLLPRPAAESPQALAPQAPAERPATTVEAPPSRILDRPVADPAAPPVASMATEPRGPAPAPAESAASGRASDASADADPSAADARRAAMARGTGGSAPGGPSGAVGNVTGSGARGTAAGDAGGGSRSASGTTASAGLHAGGEGEYGPYLAAVRRRVQDTLRYPPAAVRRNLSGTVDIEIVVNPSGDVADVRVVRSSSHAVLDAAAVDALRRLPRVPFPADVAPRTIRARLPVVFELQ